MNFRDYLEEGQNLKKIFGDDVDNMKLYKKWVKDIGKKSDDVALPIVYSPSEKKLARGVSQADVFSYKYKDMITLDE